MADQTEEAQTEVASTKKRVRTVAHLHIYAQRALITKELFADEVRRSLKVYFLAHGGSVQGVGFRYFTRKRAVERNITGWVRNTDNNKVEGEAQGEDADIKTFLKDVDKGPRYAHVVRLDKEDRELVEEEAVFEIRR